MPAARLSSVRISMCDRSSSSSSWSSRSILRSARRRAIRDIWRPRFSGKLQDAGDGLRQALPALFLFGKLLAALGGQAVVAGAAIVLRGAPLGADPAVLLHAMEGGIEGAFFDAEDVFGNQLDMESNAVAM